MSSARGAPIVVPEVQLLYKAKHAGAKDEHDLQEALPLMTAPQRLWLRQALETVHPDHPWLAALA